MIHYIRFVLRARWLVLACFGAGAIFFGYHLGQVKLSSNPREIFFGDSPQYDRYLQRNAQFGGDAIVFLGIEDKDLLSPDVLKRLRRVFEALEADPEVERVDSLINAQYIHSADDELIIERYSDLLIEDPGRRDEILAALTTDPLTRGWLITADGHNSMALVQFISDPDGTAESVPESMRKIFHAFEAEGFDTERIYRGGFVASLAEVMNESLFVLFPISPISVVVLLIAVYLMFRRMWPVVFTMAITGLAVAWTMGLAVLLYGHINILTTMVPALVLITCFADVVHLCSAYLLEISAGRDKQTAILLIGSEVGTACGWTSLTTFFGFLAMTLVPTPVFKQLGLLMGFGVAMALFMALTLVPIFLSMMPQPRPWKTGGDSRLHGWLEGLLASIARLTMSRPRTVVLVFAVVFVVACAGFAQVTFETQFSERFGASSPMTRGAEYFAEHFPATNPMDVYVETADEDGLLDPERFAQIVALQTWAEQLPQVRRVLSVTDVVLRLYQEINPELARATPLPASREALAQLFLLFEMSGGEGLERLVDEERRTMRLSARLEDLGVIETAQVGQAIQARGQELLGPDVKIETFSMEYMLGDWVDDMVAGQQRGLVFAMLTIALLMIVAMRSLRNGLISMLPNAFPLLVLLGYIGWMWDQADTDTMAVLIVAIGIGVDDTIHFLMRLRFERGKTDDVRQAVRRTFHYTGRAIVITSVILVAGFAPFALSDYFSVRLFGTMLPACLILALVADLFLVPSMVELGWIRVRARSS